MKRSSFIKQKSCRLPDEKTFCLKFDGIDVYDYVIDEARRQRILCGEPLSLIVPERHGMCDHLRNDCNHDVCLFKFDNPTAQEKSKCQCFGVSSASLTSSIFCCRGFFMVESLLKNYRGLFYELASGRISFPYNILFGKATPEITRIDKERMLTWRKFMFEKKKSCSDFMRMDIQYDSPFANDYFDVGLKVDFCFYRNFSGLGFGPEKKIRQQVASFCQEIRSKVFPVLRSIQKMIDRDFRKYEFWIKTIFFDQEPATVRFPRLLAKSLLKK